MLHVWYIYLHDWVILFGQMLLNIPAPWSKWDSIPHSMLQSTHVSQPSPEENPRCPVLPSWKRSSSRSSCEPWRRCAKDGESSQTWTFSDFGGWNFPITCQFYDVLWWSKSFWITITCQFYDVLWWSKAFWITITCQFYDVLWWSKAFWITITCQFYDVLWWSKAFWITITCQFYDVLWWSKAFWIITQWTLPLIGLDAIIG